jgi:hypothetical protein
MRISTNYEAVFQTFFIAEETTVGWPHGKAGLFLCPQKGNGKMFQRKKACGKDGRMLSEAMA